jgi:hypothetical protein
MKAGHGTIVTGRSQTLGIPFLLTCLLGVTLGCATPAETVCTAILYGVIEVDVVDSISRVPAAAGATVWLRGPYSDSLTVPDSATSSLATIWTEDHVKAGTYSVQVQKSGYHLWNRAGIRVEADRCHTTTFARLTVLLQR